MIFTFFIKIFKFQIESFPPCSRRRATRATHKTPPKPLNTRRRSNVFSKQFTILWREKWKFRCDFGVFVTIFVIFCDVIQIFESNPPGELNEICKEIIVLLSETLIKSIKEEGDASSDSAESRVFFRKMKGDYYRYMAEYQPTTTEGWRQIWTKFSHLRAKKRKFWSNRYCS